MEEWAIFKSILLLHTCSFLVIPPALRPIFKLGARGIPITLPRRATARWRALKRTMRLCRTGADTSAPLMRRRRRFGRLFCRFSKISTLRRLSTVLRVQRRGRVRRCFEATQSQVSGKVPFAFTYIAAEKFLVANGPRFCQREIEFRFFRSSLPIW